MSTTTEPLPKEWEEFLEDLRVMVTPIACLYVLALLSPRAPKIADDSHLRAHPEKVILSKLVADSLAATVRKRLEELQFVEKTGELGETDGESLERTYFYIREQLAEILPPGIEEEMRSIR